MYVVVAGGGKVGYYLARSLLDEGHEVLILERDKQRADSIADDLGSIVLRGDACEASTLADAGASRADVVVAVTGDDEDNLVICQLAKKKFNAGRTVARINNPKNRQIFNLLGVDAAISSTEIILTQIREEMPSHALLHLVRLRSRDLELVDATIGSGSPLIGHPISQAGLPMDSRVLLILRDGDAVIPTPQTEFRERDEVVALCRLAGEAALRQALGARLG
ncbi:MAG: TrkA family potassium uptake protein [Chloroflexota bacterium]|nr:MAG: TrkA family potassium uptake protein [Chloroflexota bacterium]